MRRIEVWKREGWKRGRLREGKDGRGGGVVLCSLAKSKCHTYKNRLRQLSCPVRKVSSRKDEKDSLIRLADALAGASARMEKYQEDELSELFSLAQQNGTLIEFKTENHLGAEAGNLFPQPSGRQLGIRNSFRLCFYFWSSTENHRNKRWATYLAERSTSSMAYATVFGCYFTSGVYYNYTLFGTRCQGILAEESRTYIHRRGWVQSCTMNILITSL